MKIIGLQNGLVSKHSAAKTDNLILIPRTHMTGGERNPTSCLPSDLCTHATAHTYPDK